MCDIDREYEPRGMVNELYFGLCKNCERKKKKDKK